MSGPVRIALALAALAVSAWFGLGWIQARDTNRASDLISAGGNVSASQAAWAGELLHSASKLNPDRQVDLLRAQLDFQRHDYAAAIRILRAVTRSEPENVFAWSQLGYTAGAAGQIALAQLAGRRVAELVPRIRSR